MPGYEHSSCKTSPETPGAAGTTGVVRLQSLHQKAPGEIKLHASQSHMCRLGLTPIICTSNRMPHSMKITPSRQANKYCGLTKVCFPCIHDSLCAESSHRVLGLVLNGNQEAWYRITAIASDWLSQ